MLRQQNLQCQNLPCHSESFTFAPVFYFSPTMSFSFQALAYEATRSDTLKAIPVILLGCFIAAIGLVYFINPYGIVPGGAFGISIVLHAIFPFMKIGTLGLIIQIPLLLVSGLILGGRLGIRTLVAAIALPIFVNLLTTWSYPPEAVESLDPAKLLGGHLDLTHDLIVCSLMGGVLLGIGTGIVIRRQASSGGSDIIAMILYKYTRIPFPYCMMLVDGTIVLSGLIVIGMGVGLNVGSAESKSWMLSFYSLIAMFAIARSLGMVVSGTKDGKLVHIICSKTEATVLREWILNTLDRTATRTPSYGLYSEAEKEILLLVVRQKELPSITEGIRLLAPDSFVVVTDAYDAYGFRWKALPDGTTLSLA